MTTEYYEYPVMDVDSDPPQRSCPRCGDIMSVWRDDGTFSSKYKNVPLDNYHCANCENMQSQFPSLYRWVCNCLDRKQDVNTQ
jgi:hypothetical protein